ncbi:Conserved oligomeric Golgi complex subunit 2 [Allomyces javanicus]|nr:Conserved oligomeric Golgi complex subunit 2 [Allomyces javanicus]
MDDQELRRIKAELVRKRADAQTGITQIITAQYEKLQEVISSLDAMGEWMTGVEEPLGAVQTGAKELATTSAEKHDAFEAKVRALERVRHQQKILHFFLDMDRKVAWLEHAAGIERPSTTSGGGGKTPRRQDSHPSAGTAITDLAKLEHVALLLALATAAVQHGSKSFPFIAALDVRVRAVTAVCQTSARALLMPLLRDHDHDRLAACARVYLHLNAWSQLVVLVVTAAVDPLLTRRNDVPLPTVLDELWTRLETGPVALAKILAPQVPRDQALILSTHILLRVLEYLSGTPSIFSPAVPSTFHRNYTATTTLLRRLVTALGLARVADAIPELAAFLRKWPVEVYFQMLARQAIRDVEPTITSATLLATMHHLHAVHVPGVAHRFFKLACQLVLRYRAAVAARTAGTTTTTTTTGTQALTDLAELRATATALAETPLLATFPSPSARSAFLATCDFSEVTAPLRAAVAHDLRDATATVLHLTKSIPSQFRSAGRGVPTSASPFVPLVFRSVVDVVNAHADAMAEHEWRAVVDEVVAATAARYAETVRDMLATLKQTEESLKRLKLAKGRAAAADGEVSDEAKIRMQLWLDAVALREEVRKVPYVVEGRAEEVMAPTVAAIEEHMPAPPVSTGSSS